MPFYEQFLQGMLKHFCNAVGLGSTAAMHRLKLFSPDPRIHIKSIKSQRSNLSTTFLSNLRGV